MPQAKTKTFNLKKTCSNWFTAILHGVSHTWTKNTL